MLSRAFGDEAFLNMDLAGESTPSGPDGVGVAGQERWRYS